MILFFVFLAFLLIVEMTDKIKKRLTVSGADLTDDVRASLSGLRVCHLLHTSHKQQQKILLKLNIFFYRHQKCLSNLKKSTFRKKKK